MTDNISTLVLSLFHGFLIAVLALERSHLHIVNENSQQEVASALTHQETAAFPEFDGFVLLCEICHTLVMYFFLLLICDGLWLVGLELDARMNKQKSENHEKHRVEGICGVVEPEHCCH